MRKWLMLSCEKPFFNGRKWSKQRLAIWKQFYFSVNNRNFSDFGILRGTAIAPNFNSFNGSLGMAWAAKLNTENKKLSIRTDKFIHEAEPLSMQDRESSLCGALLESTLGKTEKKVKVNVQHKWTNEWNNNHNNNASHNTKPKKVFRDRDWLFYIPLSSWISETRTNIVYHVFLKQIHYHLLFDESTVFRSPDERSNCICYFCNELLCGLKEKPTNVVNWGIVWLRGQYYDKISHIHPEVYVSHNSNLLCQSNR